MPSPGRFITLEGGEGAGKSTQAEHLATALEAAGLTVVRTREPGGTPGAERLRALLLGGEIAWSPLAEVLLHFAARAEHVARVIRPALAAGSWVVCDRFADSTLAYQGWGMGADQLAIAGLTDMLGLRPDLTLVLDVPVATSVARLAGRGAKADRYEREGEAFFARVREGFLAIAAVEPERCVVVDAREDETAVAAAVMAAVRERLGGSSPPPLVGGGRGEGHAPCPAPAAQRSHGKDSRLRRVTPPPAPLPQGEGGKKRGSPTPILEHARAMWRGATPPEQALWRALRTRVDGLKFRRQAPMGRYIADFYCPEAKLVVEVDGATHAEAVGDAARDAWMRGQGLEVLRFWNSEVMGNLEGVLSRILDVARRRPAPLGPLPRRKGER